jgi:hypothetical protein
LSLRADREPSPRFLAVPEMGNSTRKRDEKSALSSGKSLAPFAAVSLRSRRTFQVRNMSRAQIAPHYQSLLPKNVSQNIRGHKTSRAYDTFRSWKPPSQTTARLRLIAIIPCCGRDDLSSIAVRSHQTPQYDQLGFQKPGWRRNNGHLADGCYGQRQRRRGPIGQANTRRHRLCRIRVCEG